jgi:predicted ATPase/DNA-binding CsgD family transcriptional regulator
MLTSTLPIFPTPFIGREESLAQITDLFLNPACHLLTLLGPGGIGKTRLAVEVAAHQANLFNDGVYFVALQPLNSPDLLIPAIADSLQLQFYPGGDPKQQLLDHLRPKSLLLILDNFEHLLDGAEVVGEIIVHAPQVKVLATSRTRLDLVEEWVLDIGGLEDYEAVELFVQRARQVQSGFILTEAVKRICQLVGGMPLGIEMAAGWVRALPAEEIAAEIERSMDLLSTTARNVPARHRNMRAALQHSWNLLSTVEQEVFQRMSVFRGGFTREGAQGVSGASIWILTALVDKSLLRIDRDGRYQMQELLRQYAEERLRASGEMENTLDLHSLYYAQFLEARWATLRSSQQREVLDEIDAEVDNIRAAWQTLCRNRQISHLHAAAKSLWLANDLRCRFHDMVSLFGQAVEALRPVAGTEEVDRTLGLMLALEGWSYVGLGLPSKGYGLAHEGLSYLRETGTTEDLFFGLLSVQLNSYHLNRKVEIWRVCRKVLEIAQANGDRWMIARALYEFTNYKLSLFDQSQVAEAKRHAVCEEGKHKGEEALHLAEEGGDLWLQASISGFLLGNVNRTMQNYTEAKRCYERSLMLFTKVNQSWAIGAIHRMLGYNAYRMGDHPAAYEHYRASLKVFHENGQSHEQLMALSSLSNLYFVLGNQERAVQLCAFLVQHPLTPNFTYVRAKRLLLQLQTQLSPERYEGLVESGQRLELTRVVLELLEHPPQASETSPSPVTDLLTPRELEILKLLSQGMTHREIAEQLILSPGTVKWYSSQILNKLNVTNRVEAIAHARELKLLP